ncbi:MAG: glycosyltransferase [Firmicutes bacterium]|nr:glycosyltransferase [Bacillota bacterium]
MEILLVAPVMGYAMKSYVESLVIALSKYENNMHITLVVPKQFDESYIISRDCAITIVRMPTPVNKIKRGFYYFNPIAQIGLLKSLRRCKPDLVHLINGDGYLISVLLGSYFSTIPLLLTLHDPVAHAKDYIGYINSWIRNYFSLKQFDAVHIHNKCFTDMVRARLTRNQQLFVVPHGSFAHYFKCYDTSQLERENSILFFGRLEYYKGIDILVEAGIKLASGRKNVKIIIAGPGKLALSIQAEIGKNSQLFEFHNKLLSNKEVAILFKRSSITVLPYRQVTQSSVPSIAMAFGHKIIASDDGAFHNEIPRIGGLVVPAGSVDALAEAMNVCLDNTCNQNVASEDIYAWNNIALQFGSIYRTLIKK